MVQVFIPSQLTSYTEGASRLAAEGASIAQVLDDLDIPVEYGYCFSTSGDRAVDILKIRVPAEASKAVFKLEEAGFRVLTQAEL